MTAPPRPVADLSFEDALAELEGIVRDLEGGRGKLDDAIAAYERGTELRRHCDAKLAEAQARIDRIVTGPDASAGDPPTTTPFGATE
jgi:exodeoxyribonuclease VII small subunit